MSSSSNRKRSRWGASKEPPVVAGNAATLGVSDDDAIRALLAESKAKEDEKRRQQQQQDRGNRRPNKDVDNSRAKRPKPAAAAADPKSDYYGPPPGERKEENAEDKSEVIDKKKPDFGLSGALAKDDGGGKTGSNMYKGVLLKFQEPPEARAPNTLWRFYVFKGEEQIDILHISRQSAYLLGRNQDIADIPLQHPSCSSQHAVLQYRALPMKDNPTKLNCQPYLMDLESTNGSFINGVRIDSARYYQLKKGDVLKFGASTREYVLLTADTKSL